MNYFLFGVVVGGLIYVAVAYWYEAKAFRRRRGSFDSLLAERISLCPADLAAQCGAPVQMVERVLRIIATVSEEAYAPPNIPIDPSRLRPEDDLWKALGFDLDSFASIELLTALEKNFGMPFEGKDFAPDGPKAVVTVGDILEAVARKHSDESPKVLQSEK